MHDVSSPAGAPIVLVDSGHAGLGVQVPAPPLLVEVQGAGVSYGGRWAVRGLSLSVAAGEAVALVGPNGAGKSTTLKLLVGQRRPDEGSVQVSGLDVATQPDRARGAIGYMPERVALHGELRVGEYLRYRAGLKGVARPARAAVAQKAAAEVELSAVMDQLIARLSHGFRQRVALADALLAAPPLLVLDEPTTGLDPNQVQHFRALITRVARSRAVLLATHQLREAEQLCGRALVLVAGAVRGVWRREAAKAAEGAPPEGSSVTVCVRDPEGRTAAVLGEEIGAAAVTPCPLIAGGDLSGLAAYRIETTPLEARLVSERVARALVRAGIGVVGLTSCAGRADALSVQSPVGSLERYFEAVTKETAQDAGARSRAPSRNPT